MIGWFGYSVRAASRRAGILLSLSCAVGLGCGESEPIGDGTRGRPGPGGAAGGPAEGMGASGSSAIPGGVTVQPMQPPIGVAGGGAAGSGGRGSDCATFSQTAEVMLGAVDIVWIID